MAQENEASKAAADKGKGKAVEDAPKDKDGKPVANGKKEEQPESECHCSPLLAVCRWQRAARAAPEERLLTSAAYSRGAQ